MVMHPGNSNRAYVPTDQISPIGPIGSQRCTRAIAP
jgi:hypothetical protein